MKLKIKFLDWGTGVPLALLNLETAKRIGINSLDRVSIRTMDSRKKEIATIADVVKGVVEDHEVGVPAEFKDHLELKQGQSVDVNLSLPPRGLAYIKKKLNNKKLKPGEIDCIIKDIVAGSLSDAEISLFISTMYEHGMDMKETIALINAIDENGHHITLHQKYVVDKHCIGGIPGNRTTPIVVSICAAAGLTFPKTSSRAITSAAGTADVIEEVAKVDFTAKEIEEIIKKAGACIVWGGALGMVPADSRIIKIEKTLRIDPKSQLIASIISKKIAAGSKYILIDIPCGFGAKVSRKNGLILKRKFEYLGRHFGREIRCVLTDGSQPIGNGVGPSLELTDVIKVLDQTKQGPVDLEEKGLFLAGKIFEMIGKTRKGEGKYLAEEMLSTGKAFEKFKQIIKAQHGNLNRLKIAKLKKTIASPKSGRVREFENDKIAAMARITGCPLDKESGLYIHVHKGDNIKKGQELITIYSNFRSRIKQAEDFFKREKPIIIRK